MTPHADFLYDPTLTDDLFLTIASQPIGDSTPEDWVAAQMASDEGCAATEPITVDGGTGLIGVDLQRGGRHNRWPRLLDPALYVWRRPSAVAPYDRAWFEEVLATVQLHPEDAVD